MDKNSVSRVLSAVLRHKPEILGITLDKNGYVHVTELLNKLDEKKGIDLTYEELEVVVNTNNKKRFAFNASGDMIRASQGHSLKTVDLKLKNQKPPTFLYHGTVNKFLNSIKSKGLKKMNRHAVHLSEDLETATNVGSRRGTAIILRISSGAMRIDGHKFQKSDNGVWLTDYVPENYIKVLE